jgi:hypothetical protein
VYIEGAPVWQHMQSPAIVERVHVCFRPSFHFLFKSKLQAGIRAIAI